MIFAALFLRGSASNRPGLVGEDDERIGFDQVGDHRAQRVVVAELDLVGHHVSFSLITGTTPSESSVRKVERALR
jgi:hypothetical protein